VFGVVVLGGWVEGARAHSSHLDCIGLAKWRWGHPFKLACAWSFAAHGLGRFGFDELQASKHPVCMCVFAVCMCVGSALGLCGVWCVVCGGGGEGIREHAAAPLGLWLCVRGGCPHWTGGCDASRGLWRALSMAQHTRVSMLALTRAVVPHSAVSQAGQQPSKFPGLAQGGAQPTPAKAPPPRAPAASLDARALAEFLAQRGKGDATAVARNGFAVGSGAPTVPPASLWGGVVRSLLAAVPAAPLDTAKAKDVDKDKDAEKDKDKDKDRDKEGKEAKEDKEAKEAGRPAGASRWLDAGAKEEGSASATIATLLPAFLAYATLRDSIPVASLLDTAVPACGVVAGTGPGGVGKEAKEEAASAPLPKSELRPLPAVVSLGLSAMFQLVRKLAPSRPHECTDALQLLGTVLGGFGFQVGLTLPPGLP
jgi:hypothetical protein